MRVIYLVKGYERGQYKGTVAAWAEAGKLKIKSDTGLEIIVSSELVKKVADG